MDIKVGPSNKINYSVVYEVAFNPKVKISLSPRAYASVKKSRNVIERMLEKGKVVYGVTTGFGNFKNKFISKEDAAELQVNLIRSHSTGVGPPLSKEAVRAALFVRLNSLVQGYSGVRVELLELLCGLLNKDIIPIVPSQGSVGSSGDLAPLSHMGLVLMGEGEALYKGRIMPGGEALKRASLKPITFTAKEGLAWNNGTSVMTGIASIVLYRANKLINIADMASALTLEAMCGVSSHLDQRIHNIRPHPGQKISAGNIKKFIKGSKLVDSAPDRIQDAYSIRCAPQVHGAVRDAFQYVADVVNREVNSVTDNPLIFGDPDRAISGGNFHGEPIAIAMDTLSIAMSELANISERRTAKLVDSSTNEGLPMFLIDGEKAGLHSGFMISQYTAAALVSENKVLAHPASVDSIPTSANQEDHVSMGTIAARKAMTISENVENVLAIEVMTACQGIDFRGKYKLGYETKRFYSAVRKMVSFLSGDRVLSEDIINTKRAIDSLFLD